MTRKKTVNFSAKKPKKPSFLRIFAQISENPKVAEVTRQVDEMGGVGSNSSELSAEVTRQVVELFICTATVLVPTTGSLIDVPLFNW